jgi:hypothetical protein
VLRSHDTRAMSHSSSVRFSYLKFEALLLTIFIACHEDVRFPAKGCNSNSKYHHFKDATEKESQNRQEIGSKTFYMDR